MNSRYALAMAAGCVLMPTTKPATAAITFDTSNAASWKASNGIVTLDFNTAKGNISDVKVTFNGTTTDLMDPKFAYPYSGLSLYNLTGGTGTGGPLSGASYHLTGGYVDMWTTKPATATEPLNIETHWVLKDGDPGIHFYCAVRHTSTDGPASYGSGTFNFKAGTNTFTSAYLADTGPNNFGAYKYTFPTVQFQVDAGNTPGRQVQAETVDFHGLTTPLGRNFITKYDYSTFQQYHVTHGMYNSSLAAWMVMPSSESLTGGPTKQNLEETPPTMQLEYQSGHLGGPNYVPPQGSNKLRLFGPYYLRFNAIDAAHPNIDSLYQDAKASATSFTAFYESEGVLLASGYANSTKRGTVQPFISNSGGWSSNVNNNVVVLSDNNDNIQNTNVGNQYWGYLSSSGNTTLTNLVRGTYRLTAYRLGQWGEMRLNNVTVTAGQINALHGLVFTPEIFSTAAPIFTIGTPDRSAHEFQHGHDAQGHDDREYFGQWNYWQDLAANNGKVVYYATAVGSHAATNDVNKWPAYHWATFNPGLYASIYNSSDTTTDGYKYIAPSYVTNPATFDGPPWELHFTTTASQLAQGQFAVLSMALASEQGSVVALLNGHQLIWRPANASDPGVRSGVAGYTQWAALQWDTSMLNSAGQDNIITLDVTRGGVLDDALRFEITNTSADPAVRGWHDYEYLYGNTDTLPQP